MAKRGMVKRIVTVRDARLADVLREDIIDSRHAAAAALRAARHAVPGCLHPAIGVLQRRNGVKFYAYVEGVYREGTPEHLAHLLTK